MKKIFLISIGLISAIVVVMFFAQICPPKGPWPMPPWCSSEYKIYEYLVDTKPTRISQIKAINMYDTWGRNYNMGMVENTQANIESSFDRIKSLGAEEVYVHDFDRAVYGDEQDFSSTDYTIEDDVFSNDMRDESINENDLKKLVTAAHERGLKLGIKRNLTFIDMKNLIISGIRGTISADVSKNFSEFNENHSEEWINDYFQKWENRLVEKAKLYSRAGVDIMSISPTFQDPQFFGHEELADKLWSDLIDEVKNNFSGKILAEINIYGLVDGNNGKENWNKYDYYKKADITEARIYKILEKYQSPDKNQIKQDMSKMVSDLDRKAQKLGIKLSIFFAPSSYKNGLYNNPVEFLDINNQEIKNIEKDYESQSEAYNYLFESLNKTNNISRINAANFTWDDALDPEVRPRISISASFRNKPAEQIIKAWYNK
ncbi:MAG TPA: hypothetical protein P5056_00155 [Candidatus Paceibacterota bacterium]|nr:hypothetical protein [Candidatus Paceibacterota bacterium]